MSVNLRRIALLLVVPVLVGCGGGDDGDDGADDKPEASDSTTSASADGGDVSDVCSLISLDEVAEAVGAEVEEGVPTEADVVTGGSQSTCTWTGTSDATAVATVTVYTEASAADSVLTEDSVPLPEVGDDAFVGPYASVWAYAGGGSFFAQWYDFEGSDEENLPKSTALALLVRDAL
jgi:hypothetical protein